MKNSKKRYLIMAGMIILWMGAWVTGSVWFFQQCSWLKDSLEWGIAIGVGICAALVSGISLGIIILDKLKMVLP